MKAFHWTKQVIVWLGGREPLVLLSLFLLFAGTWIFIEIADEVIEGESHAVDKMVVQAMRRTDDPATPIGPRWLQEAGRDVTALGGIACLVFFTLAVAGYLWLDRNHRLTWLLLASTISGWVLSMLLKRFFSRPRPDIVPHLSHVATSSFPSGHSMLSAVVYLTLGTFLAAVVPRPRLKVYVLAVAVAITVAVGVSRVYLGVHYPTDVLAGWAAGLVWALGCWLLARWLRRRGKVESQKTA
ncbi:MAG: phosphatase PAP2 family protein [Planctomycetaceae bacterium]